jgi:hypothetical protein
MADKDKDTAGNGDEELQSKDSQTQESSGDQTQDKQTDEQDKSPDQNWEKRFKGLQPKHQKLVEDHSGLQSQYALDKRAWDTEKVEIGVQVDTLSSDLAKANEQMESLQKSNKELQGTVDSLEVKLERNALIMSEYPDLAVLEAKGLIRQDIEGDELTKALDDMRSLMVAKGESNLKDLGTGASGDGEHSSGGRGQAQGVSDISDKLMQAQKAGDHEEANRLTELLIKTQEGVFAQGE